jgi:hypothetical protein
VSRHAEIDIRSRYYALVRGYRTRAALESLLGKPPVWSTRERAWVCGERTARNLVALLESDGYTLTLTGATGHD